MNKPGAIIRPAASRLFLILVALACLLLARPGRAAEHQNVLVLYSNNRLVPGNVAVDRGLRESVVGPAGRPVQIFSEFLDQPEFGGEAYERTMTTYLREKYAARPPSAIVAVSDNALDFLLRNRAQLFPACRSFTCGRFEIASAIARDAARRRRRRADRVRFRRHDRAGAALASGARGGS